MRIDVESQLGEMSDKLGALALGLGDLSPVMQAIAAVVEGSTRERFLTKQDSEGVSWKQLSPERLKQKKGRGGILVDRGDLMRSITGHATAVSAEVGTDRPYGKYHQMGWGVPQREFLGLSEEDVLDIQDLLNDFMEDLL
jgi:phage virion morphogenesis protein